MNIARENPTRREIRARQCQGRRLADEPTGASKDLERRLAFLREPRLTRSHGRYFGWRLTHSTARRTNSTALASLSFCLMWARWVSTVLMLR